MAPYRSSRTGGATRSTRTQIDHDVFEGLPVRHWRKRPINISTAPEKESILEIKTRNLAWPELEMPRDSSLLSEMSQNLLRAARMPQAKKPVTAPSLEDDKDQGEDEDADGEVDAGFVAKRWAVLPKDMEGPEPEFLAKRRKGLPSVHVVGTIEAVGTPQMRKTKIRKTDASGNSSILEVLVPYGQTVDGELYEDETSPVQAPAPGTVVEGVGVANAEGLVIAGDQSAPAVSRRRPPPPKRKPKGPGRGRKKKVAFTGADGKPTSSEPEALLNGAVKVEDGQVVEHNQVIGHDAVLVEEGSEEDSESEDNENGDKEDGELSPTPRSSKTPPKPPSPGLMESRDEEKPPETISQSDLMPSPDAPHPNQIESEAGVANDVNPSAADNLPDEILDQAMVDAPAIQEIAFSGDSMNHTATVEVDKSSPDRKDQIIDETTSPLPLETKVETTEEAAAEIPEEEMADFADQQPEEPVREQETIDETVRDGTPADSLYGANDNDSEPIMVEPQPEELGESTVDTPSKPGSESHAESLSDPLPVPPHSIGPNHTFNFLPGLMPEQAVPTLNPEPISEPTNADDLPIKSESRIEASTAPSIEETTTNIERDLLPPPAEDVAPPPIEGNLVNTIEKSTSSGVDQSIDPEPLPATTEQEPLSNPEQEAASEPEVEPQPELSPSMHDLQTEEPPAETVPASSADDQPDPILDSDPPGNIEPPREPMPEANGRKFSFTKPNSSPKAPTPSPPTPIEDKFALRPPYVSPKAPTMSPPTPIGRSMPGSPDVLLDDDFQLPPQVDDALDGETARLPVDIAEPDRITVEAAPHVEPQMNAQIPVEHNPLDGMAEPRLGDEGQIGEQSAQFSDGEEDLLGGLERSLNSHG